MSVFANEGDWGLGHKTVHFCEHHKRMTHKWFKFTTISIIRGSSFFFNNKPETFWLCRKQTQALPSLTHHFSESTDDQNKVSFTFGWHLIFYVKKYCSLLNIAYWLAIKKTLLTRKCNGCSSYNFFFAWTFRHPIISGFSDLNSTKLGEFLLRDTKLHFNRNLDLHWWRI